MSQDAVQDELEVLKKEYSASQLLSCFHHFVQVCFQESDFRALTVSIQFPDAYPEAVLFVELKSKTLSAEVLSKLTAGAEAEGKSLVGKPQVLAVLRFCQKALGGAFVTAYHDIRRLKEIIPKENMILYEKHRQILFRFQEKAYKFFCRVTVPSLYPGQELAMEVSETNFSPQFQRMFVDHAREIARRCAHPPRPPPKKGQAPPPPPPPEHSLYKVATFLMNDCVWRFPREGCSLCRKRVLPDDPSAQSKTLSKQLKIERIYCGHLFHWGCLDKFMSSPPFNTKPCPRCGKQIYHRDWSTNMKYLETKWANKEARKREIKDVSEFLDLDEFKREDIPDDLNGYDDVGLTS
eukprot:Rmarinus@m.7145